jgi:hypothetical protein
LEEAEARRFATIARGSVQAVEVGVDFV